MLFRTNSIGVRRLSLILGLIAGCSLVSIEHTPIVDELYWNLFSIVLLFAVGFSAAWLTVRVIAWIVEGFIHDRR